MRVVLRSFSRVGLGRPSVTSVLRRYQPIARFSSAPTPTPTNTPSSSHHNDPTQDDFNPLKFEQFTKDYPELLIGPFGNKDKPIVVPSFSHERIVGCLGPNADNEHHVLWHWVKEDRPTMCLECGQTFVLKKLQDQYPDLSMHTEVAYQQRYQKDASVLAWEEKVHAFLKNNPELAQVYPAGEVTLDPSLAEPTQAHRFLYYYTNIVSELEERETDLKEATEHRWEEALKKRDELKHAVHNNADAIAEIGRWEDSTIKDDEATRRERPTEQTWQDIFKRDNEFFARVKSLTTGNPKAEAWFRAIEGAAAAVEPAPVRAPFLGNTALEQLMAEGYKLVQEHPLTLVGNHDDFEHHHHDHGDGHGHDHHGDSHAHGKDAHGHGDAHAHGKEAHGKEAHGKDAHGHKEGHKAEKRSHH